MTTGPDAVIDRITLIVSDLDRAEDDYVTTFGCTVEQRGDIEPALTGVLCLSPARGRRSVGCGWAASGSLPDRGAGAGLPALTVRPGRERPDSEM